MDTVSAGELQKVVKSHDIARLAGWAGFDIDAKDRKILQSLTQAVVWSGRYPTALKEHQSVARVDAASYDSVRV